MTPHAITVTSKICCVTFLDPHTKESRTYQLDSFQKMVQRIRLLKSKNITVLSACTHDTLATVFMHDVDSF